VLIVCPSYIQYSFIVLIQSYSVTDVMMYVLEVSCVIMYVLMKYVMLLVVSALTLFVVLGL